MVKLTLMNRVFMLSLHTHTHRVLYWLENIFCVRKYNCHFWKFLQIKKTLEEILERKEVRE